MGRGGRQKGRGVLLSSILKIFFWYDESSLEARFRVATSAKELLRRPMHALPCLTASIAYSIWWIRPAGDHVMQSVSYWLRNMGYAGRETQAARRGRLRAADSAIDVDVAVVALS